MEIKWPCKELAASMKSISFSTILVCALLKLRILMKFCLIVKKLPKMSANCEKKNCI